MSKYRQMLKEAQQELTEYAISQLEAGLSWEKCWRTADGQWPTSISSGELYKGGNLLWLTYSQMMKGYSSSQWGTYKAWKDKGGTVIKGQKSTRIIFFKPIIKEEEGEKKVYFTIKGFAVFNRDQVEGLPPIEHKENDGVVCDSGPLFDYINAEGISIIEGTPAYIPSKDAIRLPSQFTDEAGGWSAVAHEIVHSTGAEKRLNREGVAQGITGLHEYSYEELIAELGSLFICSQLGLSTESSKQQSAAYLANWAKNLKSNPDWLWKAAGQASRAVTYINNIINEEEAAA